MFLPIATSFDILTVLSTYVEEHSGLVRHSTDFNYRRKQLGIVVRVTSFLRLGFTLCHFGNSRKY